MVPLCYITWIYIKLRKSEEEFLHKFNVDESLKIELEKKQLKIVGLRLIETISPKPDYTIFGIPEISN